jgi:hypothetical protein
MVDRRTQSSDEDEVGALHRRLHRHFSDLGEERSELGVPVFALEHGLSGPELVLLRQEVAASLATGRVDRDSWLPTVVYAAEVGYRYSGDEYWPTFEAQTPGWARHGQRSEIRELFHEFTDQFGGAEPEGRWAEHFTIICWPITHAILPVDLQRHLAQLLRDFRRSLTSANLADPDLLGSQLAARSWQASSRFQTFAQDPSMLGRLAFALLARDEELSPYLLRSTLGRIVSDLSAQGQAGEWLRSAKSTAEYVRTRGFRVGESEGRQGSGETLPSAADPDLWLHAGVDGWTAYLEMPNFTPLTERLPELTAELSQRRARVEGVSGAPIARSRLLFSGQMLPLSSWPSGSGPLVQLEGASPPINALLEQQCVLTPGPRWLFKVRDSGRAKEVRGNHVRPSGTYVFVSQEPLSRELPTWISAVEAGTEGIYAYDIQTPATLDEECLGILRDCGVGARSDVAIHPAGTVPASWDGEGRAEWLAGERPILAIFTSRTAERSVWALDQESEVIEWPTGQEQIFVGFEDLEPGSHLLEVALLDHQKTIAEGSFEIGIRDPHSRPPSGTHREGLLILPTPVNPTLTELWDGVAGLEIRGPSGVRIDVSAELRNRAGELLHRKQHRVNLPVDANHWPNLFNKLLREDKSVQGIYDDAETCVFRASQANLGVATLRSEREFAPLRWAVGRDADGAFLRLINNTDERTAHLDLFEFDRPDISRSIELDVESRVRRDTGGLCRARAGDAEAVAILSPNMPRLEDLRFAPSLTARGKGAADMLKLLSLAALWGAATGSADPLGGIGRINVLRAIAGRTAALICGRDWERLEARVSNHEIDLPRADLQAGIGRDGYQLTLAKALGKTVDSYSDQDIPERVDSFAQTLSRHAWKAGVRGTGREVSEFLLRLASEPGSLIDWAGPTLDAQMKLILGSPVLLRAARFLVIEVDRSAAPSSTSTYSGWRWD